MNDHKQKVRALFDQAFEIETEDERDRFLVQACQGDEELRADVGALLDAHFGAGSFLDAPPIEIPVTEATHVTPEASGTEIGPYKLLQKLGEGGFGVVYMAQQTSPIRRKVALKIIKHGMDSQHVIARFEAERQALAMMEHPNIAKVLDAGATEKGRPYFVMELVRGDPITQYCDAARLDMETRLELFMDVCRAVQHAHQKGIIHRDIKPSNVMVTLHDGKPVPKVIDFGIAKATQQDLTDKTLFTEYRQFLGTPAYMSPEQAEMSGLGVDTRSDIYSLGVLLYELLTGTTPFEAARFRRAAIDEIVRIIRLAEPPRPSVRLNTLASTKRSQAKPQSETADRAAGGTSSIDEIARCRHADAASLARSLNGDLDWIVMKTLEKERSRRYGTATELADDVQRHLQHEPVLASPPSTLYRMRKYVRRNRGFVAAVTAVAASLIFGIAALSSANIKVQNALAVARSETVRALSAEQDLRERELSFSKEYFFTNLWRGDFWAAEEMQDRADKLGADEVWKHNASAMLAQFQGDTKTARQQLEQVLGTSPDDTIALALRSMVDYSDGDELSWMDSVEALRKQDRRELTYDETLIVAYASALPYPNEAIAKLDDLEADHRNYPVVRLVRAMAQRYSVFYSDDLVESRNLIRAALQDLKLVEGALGTSPLALHALITINLQARDTWRMSAAADADLAEELNVQASDFERTALEHADEAAARFPRSFDAIWASAIAFQETGHEDRFAQLIDRAELPVNHPIWNDMCALYWLGCGEQEKAKENRKNAQDHPRSIATKFVDHWIQLCDSRSNGTEFRSDLKQEIAKYANARIDSRKGEYLFLDVTSLLLLGERDQVKDLANRAIANIDDASIDWFEPIYHSLKDLDFDAATFNERWPDYKGPLMLAYMHFLAACDAIGNEDRDAARESFQSCIDQGVFSIWIHWASRAFLSRMEAGWPQWIATSK